jgi:glucan phosphorylase
LKEWLVEKIRKKGNSIKLSILAIELSGKKNCVSRLHAREASKNYTDYDGKTVNFDSVTNGIAIDRWGETDLLSYYRSKNVLDSFDIPDIEKISLLEEKELRIRKSTERQKLRSFLQQRKDQNGEPIIVPDDAKIINWRRRIANYKRAGLVFTDSDKFAQILEEENMRYIMAGNVHPNDGPMKEKLGKILSIINNNEILKKRVHFIQDYDEALGKALARGADISVNTPIVGREACGTSGMKDMLNNVIVISTEDGWLADPSVKAKSEEQPVPEPAYLRIAGNNKQEEVASLYENLKKASQILDGKADISWGDYIKKQHVAYLPIISGSRMEKDYINLGFPVQETIIFAS